MRKWRFFLTGFSIVLLATNISWARSINGFVLKNPLVPEKEILSGGPPRDGIPSIDQPHFVSAKKAAFLNADDLIIGISQNKETKAYPIRILNWHEIVNDTIDGIPVVISYCPLCGTGISFERGKTTFGVSGLLYQSDLLLYDRKTDSLWSQILMKAINGPKKGEIIKLFPSSMMSWARWQKTYPHTLVLSTNTGYKRPYDRSPYGNYDSSDDIKFPINHRDNRQHPKTITFALIKGKNVKLYPVSSLGKTKNSIVDTFAGQKVQMTFYSKDSFLEVKSLSGKPVTLIRGFWFALATFYPEAEVYEEPKNRK